MHTYIYMRTHECRYAYIYVTYRQGNLIDRNITPTHIYTDRHVYEYI